MNRGRNAFRKSNGRDLIKDFDAMDMDEFRRQQFAIRSFTESVELDTPPCLSGSSIVSSSEADNDDDDDNEEENDEDFNQNLLNGSPMKSSSTVDTIIEVLNDSIKVDKTLGETQKYVMSVSGPGNVDQEIELHKSLLKDVEDLADDEILGNFNNENIQQISEDIFEKVQKLSESIEQENIQSQISPISNLKESEDSEALRRAAYVITAIQRPRPTTPTMWCALDTYVAETEQIVADSKLPVKDRRLPDSAAKIRVSIPTCSNSSNLEAKNKIRRRRSTNASIYNENIMQQKPAQSRSTTANSFQDSIINKTTEEDLLEKNPKYAHIAPPIPVVHRRSSVDWEGFENDTTTTTTTIAGIADSILLWNSERNNKIPNEFSCDLSNPQVLENDLPEYSEAWISNNNENSISNNSIITTTTKIDNKTQEELLLLRKQVADLAEQTKFFEEKFFDENSNNNFEKVKEMYSDNKTTYFPSTNIAPVRAAPPPPPPLPPSTVAKPTEINEQNLIENVPPLVDNFNSSYGGYEGTNSTEANTSYINQSTNNYDNRNYDGIDDNEIGPLKNDSYNNQQTNEYANNYQSDNIDNYDNYDNAQQQTFPNNNQQEQITTAYNNDYINYPLGNYNELQAQNYPTDPYANSQQYNAYGAYDYNNATNIDSYDSSTIDAYDTITPQINVYDNTTETNPFVDGAGIQTEAYNNPPTDTYDYSSDPYAANYAALYGNSGVEEYPQTTANYYNEEENYSEYGNQSTDWETKTIAPHIDTTYDYGNNPTVTTSFYNNDAEEPVDLKPFSTTTTIPIIPILPQQRARTPDPFSWEALESGKTVPPPPRPPPMTPSPEPPPLPSQESPMSEPKKDEIELLKKSPAPARPARPPASPTPIRPPPPSLSGSPFPRHREEEKSKNFRKSHPETQSDEEEEDPWAKFNQMSAQVSNVVKNTQEQLKNLSENSTADTIQDESYLAQIGGHQGFKDLTPAQRHMIQQQEEAQKKLKADKKKKKGGKRSQSPSEKYDVKREQDLEAATAELVKKMASTRADLADWKPPADFDIKEKKEITPSSSSTITKVEIEPTNKESIPLKTSLSENVDLPTSEIFEAADFSKVEVEKEAEKFVPRNNWADFDDSFNDTRIGANLPASESDFFNRPILENLVGTGIEAAFALVPDAPLNIEDPFKPISAIDLINENYDPFDIRPAEDLIAAARQKAELEKAKVEAVEDVRFFTNSNELDSASKLKSTLSTPTPEGGSLATTPTPRPDGFEDDFKWREPTGGTPTPLYDEDDSVVLEPFREPFKGDGWELMLRHPLKKKLMTDRFWKPCFVRIQGNMILIFNAKEDTKPFQEILIQSSYSLSENILQAYDIYGKIHTVKLQHILYKERIGLRPGQISRFVDGQITMKYGLPLEHAAQCTVLAKFGSLNGEQLNSFINAVEDLLFRCIAKRETSPFYKQDEVQIHCYDEYTANVDKDGIVSGQKARVRLFCLSFLSGSPLIEIGLNDRRRQGKEIVRRKDILPMYTERWIRFEQLDFHNTVDQAAFEEDQVIRLQPPDGCFFEIMRFRVRPPKNREKALTVKCLMKMAGSKIEIKIDTMAAAQQQLARGTTESSRMIPCEDIQIHFPIPEAWIYIFREERHWGVGSVHSKTRRIGKVKNLKDRLMGAVQHTEQTLIEVAIGEAKYEHLFRALVWRIPRLPEKHHAAYKSHQLKCRFELSSFDLMPERFLPTCNVEFTMPMATVSNTVVRSVSVEQHEDSERVEKFVRYVAKYQHNVDIDYVQCNDLDNDLNGGDSSTICEQIENDYSENRHISAFNPDDVQAQHDGYGINSANRKLSGDNSWQFSGSSGGNATGGHVESGADFLGKTIKNDSSSDEEEQNDNKSKKIPIIEINMKGYGY